MDTNVDKFGILRHTLGIRLKKSREKSKSPAKIIAHLFYSNLKALILTYISFLLKRIW